MAERDDIEALLAALTARNEALVEHRKTQNAVALAARAEKQANEVLASARLVLDGLIAKLVRG